MFFISIEARTFFVVAFVCNLFPLNITCYLSLFIRMYIDVKVIVYMLTNVACYCHFSFPPLIFVIFFFLINFAQ